MYAAVEACYDSRIMSGKPVNRAVYFPYANCSRRYCSSSYSPWLASRRSSHVTIRKPRIVSIISGFSCIFSQSVVVGGDYVNLCMR